MPRVRDLLAIPVRRSTWQRFVYLGIGVALVAPFGTLAGFIAPVLEGGLGETAAWTVASVLCFGPLTMATGMLASVRDLEIAVLRSVSSSCSRRFWRRALAPSWLRAVC